MWHKWFDFVSLMIFLILVGCEKEKSLSYNDEDIAAIVRGEEITIGDLRFLYMDDEMLDLLEGTIKQVLVMQEAKMMNLDISEQIEDWGEYPPTEADNSFREFAELQAKKLGMEPEAYYEKYIYIVTERMAYMEAYIMEWLGEPLHFTEEYIEQYNEQGNQLMDELVESYKDEIEILIK